MRTGNTKFERVEMYDSDGNKFTTRSGFEAKWAEYLDLLLQAGEIDKYEYEPEEFEFEGIKRGRGAFYKPDFLVWNKGEQSGYYVECKGYLDQVSYTKIKRFLLTFEDLAEGFQLVMQQIPKKGKQAVLLDRLRPMIAGVDGRIIDAKECLRNVKF